MIVYPIRFLINLHVNAMRPDDLKSPFSWDKRHIVVCDRIWYVPKQYDDFASFSFPGWADPLFFGQNKPVCLEYCSGNGAWIAAKAQEHPELNWVAVEQKFVRVRKIWSKIKNLNLSNLLAICGEGYRITHHYIPSETVFAVYINFPDPWPKRRHAKFRIIQPAFVKEIHRILQRDGTLTMVTDDEVYSRYMIEIMHQFPAFQSLYPETFYTNEYPSYGTSYFEDLWREKGKQIYYHTYRKIA